MGSNQLKSQETKIYLDKDKFLKLNELLIFPNGMDGLHIWEAGIMLARYIVFNNEQFKQRSVLELGSGVGIGGFAAAKFTQASSVTLSDWKPEIVNNITANAYKNSLMTSKLKVIQIDWTVPQSYIPPVDIVIGSDLIYTGCPIYDLYNTICKSLKVLGQAYIIIPDKRSAAQEFLEVVDLKKQLTYQKIQLTEQHYFKSPLQNEQQGFQTYPGIKELKFYMYIFTKIKM